LLITDSRQKDIKMLECQKCTNQYFSNNLKCNACGFVPIVKNKFILWDSKPSHQKKGFKPQDFSVLAKLEEKHFWFKVRNKIILWAIKKYSPTFNSFMEIGCGTGFVLNGIAKQYPSASIVGSELFIEGLEYAAHRVPQATCVQMDARQIPYKDEFDLIGAFDVLEHIEDDKTVLQNIYKALTPNGKLILTVPQHQWLWSKADVFACHERRYSFLELEKKLTSAGFKILKSTSFVSLLLPVMLLSRLQSKKIKSSYDPLKEFKIHRYLNMALETILNFEKFLISLNINFPFGGSRLVVAHKDSRNLN